MKVGFTGTRTGMTGEQVLVLLKYLLTLDPDEFHHGDCLGADGQAHRLVQMIFPTCTIYIHPPDNPKHRAYCVTNSPPGVIISHPERPYLDRNHDIVDACDILIATPKEDNEVLRSGTWATVRYAVTKGIPLLCINPNGRGENSV